MLEFNVKDGLICLSQLQNSPNKALTEIIGEYFKLFKLKRVILQFGFKKRIFASRLLYFRR